MVTVQAEAHNGWCACLEIFRHQARAISEALSCVVAVTNAFNGLGQSDSRQLSFAVLAGESAENVTQLALCEVALKNYYPVPPKGSVGLSPE